MPEAEQGIAADWPAPAGIRAFQGTVTSALPDGMPSDPCWLRQVHGVEVARPARAEQDIVADAAVTSDAGTVLAIRTADCLPVLLCARDGSVVAAAHAGWRGLAGGVLERAVAATRCPAGDLIAWLGPCIGQDAFEIGPEVRTALLENDPGGAVALRPGSGDRWHADLEILARRRLEAAGVLGVYGGGWCTFSDPARFHSYRRTGGAGRMATLIWMEPQ